MNKLYNTQAEITNKIREFLKNNVPNLRKTQLNIIPEIIFGMIFSESVVSTDIAKCLKNEFSHVQLESIQKRIRRFFNNKLFNPENFYNSLVFHVISSYKKKHKDNRIHITFDHMFSHDNYVTLMFTMRVEHAIQNYSHRFGSIECVFKNQKSNGLYLEAINNASEKAYNTMYTLACTVVLFLTILGADYSKNTRCYKNEKIVTHKVYKEKGKVRIMSLFKIGLTLFHRAINSTKYIRLPIRFILYDI